MKYAYLEPTDVVAVEDGQFSHTMRITKISFNSIALEVSAVAEDQSAYDIYIPPATTPSDLKVIAAPGKTNLKILDLPMLPGDDVSSGIMRFAAYGNDEGWRGSAIYRSDDSGVNYNLITTASLQSKTGTVTNVIANGPSTVIDRTSTITVIIQEGELESITEQALLNGGNLCLVGDELLQFQTATLIAGNKYTLSNLLRGRLGTEWAIATHSLGDGFVMVDSRVEKQQISSALIGLSRLYKAVSIGATLGQTDAVSFNYSGKALRPYSPVHINGSRDGGNNLSINWIRRTRGGETLRDYVDAPLNEMSEKYEVEILNGANLVRTITNITSTNTAYTAAQQVSDFGSVQSSVSVKIYQISESIGRGYAAIAVI